MQELINVRQIINNAFNGWFLPAFQKIVQENPEVLESLLDKKEKNLNK